MAAEISEHSSGELKAGELPLLPPLVIIHSEDPLTEKVNDDVMVVLPLGVYVEVGLEHVLHVPRVHRVDLALPAGSKEPEGWVGLGNLCEVMVECGEVEELVEDCAFHGWVSWVPYGLSSECG